MNQNELSPVLKPVNDTVIYSYTLCLKVTCAKLFSSELWHISTNGENFAHKDGKKDKLM